MTNYISEMIVKRATAPPHAAGRKSPSHAVEDAPSPVRSTMIIGIVSDTHGHVEFTRPAIRLLESCEVDLVIHCGDIGSPEVVECFAPWPTHFVFGNVNTQPIVLRKAIETAGQTCHERFGELELAGRHIAFLHGDDAPLLVETIADGRFDLVCYGHTHVAEQHVHGKTKVVNPGALFARRRIRWRLRGCPS